MYRVPCFNCCILGLPAADDGEVEMVFSYREAFYTDLAFSKRVGMPSHEHAALLSRQTSAASGSGSSASSGLASLNDEAVSRGVSIQSVGGGSGNSNSSSGNSNNGSSGSNSSSSQRVLDHHQCGPHSSSSSSSISSGALVGGGHSHSFFSSGSTRGGRALSFGNHSVGAWSEPSGDGPTSRPSPSPLSSIITDSSGSGQTPSRESVGGASYLPQLPPPPPQYLHWKSTRSYTVGSTGTADGGLTTRLTIEASAMTQGFSSVGSTSGSVVHDVTPSANAQSSGNSRRGHLRSFSVSSNGTASSDGAHHHHSNSVIGPGGGLSGGGGRIGETSAHGAAPAAGARDISGGRSGGGWDESSSGIEPDSRHSHVSNGSMDHERSSGTGGSRSGTSHSRHMAQGAATADSASIPAAPVPSLRIGTPPDVYLQGSETTGAAAERTPSSTNGSYADRMAPRAPLSRRSEEASTPMRYGESPPWPAPQYSAAVAAAAAAALDVARSAASATSTSAVGAGEVHASPGSGGDGDVVSRVMQDAMLRAALVAASARSAHSSTVGPPHPSSSSSENHALHHHSSSSSSRAASGAGSSLSHGGGSPSIGGQASSRKISEVSTGTVAGHKHTISGGNSRGSAHSSIRSSPLLLGLSGSPRVDPLSAGHNSGGSSARDSGAVRNNRIGENSSGDDRSAQQHRHSSSSSDATGHRTSRQRTDSIASFGGLCLGGGSEATSRHNHHHHQEEEQHPSPSSRSSLPHVQSPVPPSLQRHEAEAEAAAASGWGHNKERGLTLALAGDGSSSARSGGSGGSADDRDGDRRLTRGTSSVNGHEQGQPPLQMMLDGVAGSFRSDGMAYGPAGLVRMGTRDGGMVVISGLRTAKLMRQHGSGEGVGGSSSAEAIHSHDFSLSDAMQGESVTALAGAGAADVSRRTAAPHSDRYQRPNSSSGSAAFSSTTGGAAARSRLSGYSSSGGSSLTSSDSGRGSRASTPPPFGRAQVPLPVSARSEYMHSAQPISSSGSGHGDSGKYDGASTGGSGSATVPAGAALSGPAGGNHQPQQQQQQQQQVQKFRGSGVPALAGRKRDRAASGGSYGDVTSCSRKAARWSSDDAVDHNDGKGVKKKSDDGEKEADDLEFRPKYVTIGPDGRIMYTAAAAQLAALRPQAFTGNNGAVRFQ